MKERQDTAAAGSFRGPLEDGSWPARLSARVVDPGPNPRVHGYDVESDLAQNYRFSDLVFLALSGELPSERCAAAFEVVLLFLAPLSVAHAPAHASVLARLCGASTSSTLGVAGVALGEQARFTLDEHECLLQALEGNDLESVARFRSSDPVETQSTERLIAALSRVDVRVPGLHPELSRMAALLLVLHHCGIREREGLEAVLVISRLACCAAEAFAERAANFDQYPINLPRYVYEE